MLELPTLQFSEVCDPTDELTPSAFWLTDSDEIFSAIRS